MINGKLGAIIVGAGSSNRMHGIDKIFSRIIDRPVLAYSMDIMAKYKKIDELVLVLSNENLEDGKRLLDSESTWPSNWKVMKGGLHRMDSVWIGIQALCNVDWVVIHDAARPCITMDLLKNVIKKAEDVGAAIPVGNTTDTVKRIDSKDEIVETLNRDSLVLAQTPQVFRMDLLKSAYGKFSHSGMFTDEATLLELSSNKVKILRNPDLNPKITYPEDLVIAESIIMNRIQGKI